MDSIYITLEGDSGTKRTFKKPTKMTPFILDKIRKRFKVESSSVLNNKFFESLTNDYEKLCEFFAVILQEKDKPLQEVDIDELKNFLYTEIDVRELVGSLNNFFGQSKKK